MVSIMLHLRSSCQVEKEFLSCSQLRTWSLKAKVMLSKLESSLEEHSKYHPIELAYSWIQKVEEPRLGMIKLWLYLEARMVQQEETSFSKRTTKFSK